MRRSSGRFFLMCLIEGISARTEGSLASDIERLVWLLKLKKP
uniref:Uncharacterized protein n=1 Tax=Arundo donax TaxID=35708 RepID=A0A0A8ZLN3_ARUDO